MTIEECICLKCGYTWTPKVNEPKQCPSCKSMAWRGPNSAGSQRAKARKIAANEFGEGAIKNKVVHHKDGNPWNNNVTNLEILTIAAHRKKHTNWTPIAPYDSIIIRNVPESVRRDLKSKAALEGKSMQGVVLELITKYTEED